MSLLVPSVSWEDISIDFVLGLPRTKRGRYSILWLSIVSDEIMNMFAASGVYIEMSPWPPPFRKMGRQGYVAVTLKITLSRG
jgi:hypothetical protein